jgi:uncharacterized membrane protein
MKTATPRQENNGLAHRIDQFVYFVSARWILVFTLVYGVFVLAPFVAPIFMQIGWERAGKAIFLIYTLLCHQLPQRSFFLFGQQTMYPLSEIQAVWQDTTNPLVLRQFIGNHQMGWKVAWSDRMVSMYTSVLIIGWLWWLFRRKVKHLPLWGLILLALPMVVDGTSHFISDLAGIGQGFRDSNAWLVPLTGKAFSPSFYAGDSLGSFNFWMRFITGVLFGLGFVWFSFPHLDLFFTDITRGLKFKFRLTDPEDRVFPTDENKSL